MEDESGYPTLTFAEIKKLKVAELKTRLSNLGLPVSGLCAVVFDATFLLTKSEFFTRISVEFHTWK